MIDGYARQYNGGYIERDRQGRYRGRLSIEGVDISPITAVYFTQEGEKCLWLRREKALVYDFETQSYGRREKEPRWEAYLKQDADDVFRGTFNFLRFRFDITGVFDPRDKEHDHLDLYVERKPMSQQAIINKINERNKSNHDKKR